MLYYYYYYHFPFICYWFSRNLKFFYINSGIFIAGDTALLLHLTVDTKYGDEQLSMSVYLWVSLCEKNTNFRKISNSRNHYTHPKPNHSWFSHFYRVQPVWPTLTHIERQAICYVQSHICSNNSHNHCMLLAQPIRPSRLTIPKSQNERGLSFQIGPNPPLLLVSPIQLSDKINAVYCWL